MKIGLLAGILLVFVLAGCVGEATKAMDVDVPVTVLDAQGNGLAAVDVELAAAQKGVEPVLGTTDNKGFVWLHLVAVNPNVKLSLRVNVLDEETFDLEIGGVPAKTFQNGVKVLYPLENYAPAKTLNLQAKDKESGETVDAVECLLGWKPADTSHDFAGVNVAEGMIRGILDVKADIPSNADGTCTLPLPATDSKGRVPLMYAEAGGKRWESSGTLGVATLDMVFEEKMAGLSAAEIKAGKKTVAID